MTTGGAADPRLRVERADALGRVLGRHRALGHDRPARSRFEVFIHRPVREGVAMTAIIGSPEVLQHATRLACMGVDVDPHRNEAATGDADLSSAAATVRSLVVPARGNLRIARQVMAVLASLEQPRSAASRR